MAATPKALANGQLPSSKTTLYTASSSSSIKTIVASIILTNTTAGSLTVNLYLKASGGTSRKILDTYSLAAHATYVFQPHAVIETSGVIEGDASSATSIDYWITGAEIQ